MIAANQAKTVLDTAKETIKNSIRAKLNSTTVLSKIADAAGDELKSQLKRTDVSNDVKVKMQNTIDDIVTGIKLGAPQKPQMLHGICDEMRNQIEDLLVGNGGLIDSIFNAVEAAFNAYDAGCMLGHKSVTGAPGSITPIIVT